MSQSESQWILAVTCRCVTEDLGLLFNDCEKQVEELADHPVIQDFVERRRQSPIGAETIQSLLPDLVVFSLHSGRYRGATWYGQDIGMVWLLAVEVHREGSRQDAYPYFQRLHEAGRLLPTRQDVERVISSREPTFKRVLVVDLPQFRRTAINGPNRVHETTLGGRVEVRTCFESEDGEEGLLSLAITPRLLPGSVQLPVTWLSDILAAYFSSIPLEEVGYVPDLAGHSLTEGEFCVAAWIDRCK